MNNTFISTELYDKKSLFTLGGASTAVWIFTNIIGNVIGLDVENQYKWIGLAISITISLIGATQIKEKYSLIVGTVAFFNGLLIFVTASGINAINQSIPNSSNQKLEAGILNKIDNKSWWVPIELKNENENLRVANDSLIYANILVKNTLDSCLLLNKKESTNNDSTDYYKDKFIMVQKELKALKLKPKVEKINEVKIDNNEGAKIDSFTNEKPKILNYINALILANQDLTKNIKNYLEAGRLNPTTQQQAYRNINISVITLNTDLKTYNTILNNLAEDLK